MTSAWLAGLCAASPALAAGPPWIRLDEESTWIIPEPRDESSWRFDVMPFGWVAGAEGSQSAEGRGSGGESVVESSSELDFAAMLRAEAGAGDFSIRLNGVYLDIESEATGSSGTQVDATLRGLIGDLALGYRIAGDPWHEFDGAKRGKARPGFVDALVGARVTDLRLDLDYETRPSESGRETWVDPFVGLRGRVFAFPWLSLGAEATAGGFGVGSQFAWTAEGIAQIVLSETVYVALGYSILDVDYSSGNGFELDAQIRGPWFGVGFVF